MGHSRSFLSDRAFALLLTLVVVGYLPYALDRYGAERWPLLLLAAGVLHVAAAGVGTLIVGRLVPSFLVSPSMRLWLWGWTVGVGVFGLVIWCLALLNAFVPAAAGVVVLAGLLCWIPQREALSGAFAALAAGPPGALRPGGFAACSIVIVLFVTFVASAPCLFPDALYYHLALPMQYVAHGGAIHDLHATYTGMPLLAEMAMSPALLITGLPEAMNVAHALGLGLLGGWVYWLAAEHIDKASAGPAAFALLIMPVVGFCATALKSDLFYALFVAAALDALVLLVRERAQGEETSAGRNDNVRGHAALFGLALGLALASKYPALLPVGILGGSLIAVPSWRRRLGWKTIALAALVATIVGALPYVKNAIVFGNPLYPFAQNIFGGPDFGVHTAELYRNVQATKAFRTADQWLHFYRFPVTLTFENRDFSMNNLPGPHLLVFWPVLLLLRPVPPALRWFTALLLVMVPIWLWTHAGMRYLPLLWIVGALSVGWVVRSLSARSLFLQLLATTTLSGCAAAALIWSLSAGNGLLRNPASHLFGSLDRDAFLEAGLPSYRAFRFLNEKSPAQTRVLLLGDGMVAYLQRPARFADPFGEPLLIPLFKDLSTPQEIIARLKKWQIDVVMVEPGGLNRTQGFGWPLPDLGPDSLFSAFIGALGAPVYAEKGAQVYRVPSSALPPALPLKAKSGAQP